MTKILGRKSIEIAEVFVATSLKELNELCNHEVCNCV